MRICYTEVEFLQDEGILKNIERAGRTCYKSENKITEDSALSFVNMIKDRKHLSVLEHGSVYLKVLTHKLKELNIVKNNVWCYIIHSPYGQETNEGYSFIYTNLRYIYESNPELAELIINGKALPEGVEYFTPEKDDPYKRYSFRIITNFKISEQYVRHRVFSHSKESSRYCNYAKERFNGETAIVIPFEYEDIFFGYKGKLEGIDEKWYFTPDIKEDSINNIAERCEWKLEEDSSSNRFIFDFLEKDFRLHKILSRCKLAEMDYIEEIKNGIKPENARDLLTLYTKTEQVMTGFLKDWRDLINKRSIPGAQYEARYIADCIKRCLKKETSKSSDLDNIFESAKLSWSKFSDDIRLEPVFG